jgi:hypothetical protein
MTWNVSQPVYLGIDILLNYQYYSFTISNLLLVCSCNIPTNNDQHGTVPNPWKGRAD